MTILKSNSNSEIRISKIIDSDNHVSFSLKVDLDEITIE